MVWFLMERYVHSSTGFTHLNFQLPSPDLHKAQKTFEKKLISQNMSDLERKSLFCLADFISNLSENKRNVPSELVESDVLFERFKLLCKEVVCSKVNLKAKNSVDYDQVYPFLNWPKTEKVSKIFFLMI